MLPTFTCLLWCYVTCCSLPSLLPLNRKAVFGYLVRFGFSMFGRNSSWRGGKAESREKSWKRPSGGRSSLGISVLPDNGMAQYGSVSQRREERHSEASETSPAHFSHEAKGIRIRNSIIESHLLSKMSSPPNCHQPPRPKWAWCCHVLPLRTGQSALGSTVF